MKKMMILIPGCLAILSLSARVQLKEVHPSLETTEQHLAQAEAHLKDIEQQEKELKELHAKVKKQKGDASPIQKGLSQIARIKKDAMSQIYRLHKQLKSWMKAQFSEAVYPNQRISNRI